MIGLLKVFARERTERLEGTQELSFAYRGAAARRREDPDPDLDHQ
jgi:hypothetical protein